MTRVLVVDDEPIVGRVIAEILRREGYEADAVGRAEDGLRISRELSFSLALIDIRLPDMDGLELAKQIHAEFPDQRIVIMSGGPEAHDDAYKRRATSFGISEVISKPFSHTDLMKIVANRRN